MKREKVHGYRRVYPSSGCEYSRPHTQEARYAQPEERKQPKEVWVRCCNKMHPVRITESGRVRVPAHKNLKAERMMIRMGAKEPRCLQILRLWKGDKPRTGNDEMERWDYSFNKKLQKHLPQELKRAYCAGIKHRDSKGGQRFRFVTPIFNDDMTWYPLDKDEKDYWFEEVLPQMAVERLLMRELQNTPKVMGALQGKTFDAYSFSFIKEKAHTQTSFIYGGGIHLSIETSWYERGKLKINGTLDPSFVHLAMSGQNRTKTGDLILGRYPVGSARYRHIQEGLAEGNSRLTGPGVPFVINGHKDIYIALTIVNGDAINKESADTIVESQMGVLGEKGEWLCLQNRTSN